MEGLVQPLFPSIRNLRLSKMKVTCEKAEQNSPIECKSIVTIMSSTGAIIDRIAVPHDNGVQYCTENPNTIEGERFGKAITKVKAFDSRPHACSSDVWRCVKYLTPSKSGFFWMSDGVEVWAATVATHAQANTITTREKARFFLPITENAPYIPLFPTLH